ncbi:MAG: hypothetical protein K2M51_00700, partial [Helicobacter sp.]|nr:hypothetical protein [Helicobacter sp.]
CASLSADDFLPPVQASTPDEIQASQLACKLLSLLFARKQILGPDKIGLSKADLGKIEASLRKSATAKPSQRRSRRRSQPRYRQHY